MLETLSFGQTKFSGQVGGSLVQSAPRFRNVADVLNSPTLSRDEKRAILSSWASDAWVIPSAPDLRLPPGAEGPMRVQEILSALRRLDEPSPPPRPGGASMRLPPKVPARRMLRARIGRLTRRYLERHVFRPPEPLVAQTG